MPELEEKTGEFRCQAWLGPEVTEAEKRWTSTRLLEEMGRRVGSVVEDGRAYELVATVSAWAPDLEGAWPPGYKRRRVDFTLVLVDPLQAEVGERVRDLPVAVPDDRRAVRLGEGYGEASGWVFERIRYGWQRVE